jgi:hypothetical protein
MQIRSAVVVAALGLASLAHGQQAVQWRVEDGGNGHWYRRVPDPAVQSFDASRGHALALGGDLASITSAAENEFVRLVAAPFSIESGVLIGTRVPPDCENFAWTDGEPWGFTAWGAWQPNCKTGNGVGFYPDGWHDLYDWHVIAFVAEWSADCNGDGIVDYGQILDGTFEDANENGVPDCCDAGESCEPCPGDITGGGQVNGVDLAAILGAWGTDGQGKLDCDINDDGTVDAQDLAIVLGGWGNCP